MTEPRLWGVTLPYIIVYYVKVVIVMFFKSGGPEQLSRNDQTENYADQGFKGKRCH
jgi:hypothetical protein